MMKLLFTAKGRINRARFWGASMIFGACLVLVCGIIGYGVILVAPPVAGPDGQFSLNGPAAIPIVLLYFLYIGLSLWVGICLGIKRYHDLDKAGAWILIIFVPVVGGLIYFIQAGCSRGTAGPNRFGADPLREFA